MRLVSVAITTLLALSPAVAQASAGASAVRTTATERHALRAFTLAGGSVFTTFLSAEHEDHAMTASLRMSDGGVQRFRATQWLPDDAYAEGTAGQIYAAAILEDERTMAVSIGWTNRAGRNINGIALLDRKAGGWERRTVVVLRGSVRDLAAAPDNGLLAVTADAHREQPVTALLLLDREGRIRAELHPLMLDSVRANEVALAIRLQTLSDSRIAFYRIDEALGRVFRITSSSPCRSPVRRDGVFTYPRYGDTCYRADTERLLAFPHPDGGDTPAESPGILAIHMNDNGSMDVVREVAHGRKPQVLVSRYGTPTGTRTHVRDGALQAVRIEDGRVIALELQSDGSVRETSFAVVDEPSR